MNILTKVACMCMLCIFALTSVQAQKKGFAFGIKGGVNLSRLTMGDVFTTRYDDNGNPYLGYDGKEVRDNLKQSFKTRTGAVGGIYARFGRTFFIQPEVLVSTKGGSFQIIQTNEQQPVTKTVDIKYSNIDVPLLVGFKGGPIRILAGPVTSFRIGDNQRLRDAFKYYTSDLNNAMSQATFGYQLGAGLDLGSFSLDVRKEGSFTNLASFQVNGQPAGGDASVKQKISSWQVTLGLKLF
ncbi:porin family protein [Dyadobacter pollutisoli]|uniref:Porin family protein n=1 Tax=Dyadobacter pollutisoli TaxID=2910158 RepID=A0A9E8N558_9BACT|nr:porin family protein [Dyadobacter pollutisoli]WAC09994.1 porin family protein [Dyadobacter pollutisoli]